MKVTVTASTGAEILVWRTRETFFARDADDATEPQICLAVDLFEVIAELAGLDLERPDHAAEALAMAEDAQRRTRLRHVTPPEHPRPGLDPSIAADHHRGGT
jgi:hypothetical protein